jgi:hypothetical protein
MKTTWIEEADVDWSNGAEAKKAVRQILFGNLQYPWQYPWEQQSFGMLRLYLDPEKKRRLQIWDQRLAIPGNNAIHSHPWSFTSTIVAGTLFNQRYDMYLHGTLRATGYKIRPGIEGEIIHGPIETLLQAHQIEVYGNGESYSQHSSELHITRFESGTITIIDRNVDADDEVWSLAIGDVPPQFIKPRPANRGEIAAVCQAAFKKWWL